MNTLDGAVRSDVEALVRKRWETREVAIHWEETENRNAEIGISLSLNQ